MAILLASLLALVIAAVALSPFWAPAIASLLPWGPKPSTADYNAIEARVSAIQARPIPDIEAIKSADAALAQRVAAMEREVAGLHREEEGEAPATQAALAQLTHRADALDTQLASRTRTLTDGMGKMEEELAERAAADGNMAGRLATLERQAQTQSSADRADSLLLLALLQMRQAVDEALPFPAEYAAFTKLAGHDPDLAAAVQPLADDARDGVASNARLRRQLAALAETITSAKPPQSKAKWWQQALDRLRRLVRIRRIDGAAKAGSQTAVETSQSALAQGDLAGAIAALEKLTGPNAEVAQPWLRSARRRLAAERALTRLQALLTDRLVTPPGSPPAGPASLPAPSAAPPPAAVKTPS